MNAIYNKMKYKGSDKILILNQPEEVEKLMSDFPNGIDNEIEGIYDFIVLFLKDTSEVFKWLKLAVGAMDDDGILWFCYPKGASKKYRSDINRDMTWEIGKPYGLRPVAQVSIDLNWSAVRMRQEKYVNKK